MQIADYIDADLLDKFEFHNYNHAIEIITQAFPEEWREVVECLRKLDIPQMTCVKQAETRLRFLRNLMMFSTRMGGEKSGFREMCIRDSGRSAAGFILRHTDVSGLFRETDHLPQVFLRHSPQIAEEPNSLTDCHSDYAPRFDTVRSV